MHHYVERVVDLLDPHANRLHNMDVAEARRRVLSGDPAAVRAIDGSYALVAVDGRTVRMARSLDRPMRYFLAKRKEGPALFIADRIDTLCRALEDEGLHGQFHPSYTRMLPAHYVVELALVGCPDPDPDLHAVLHARARHSAARSRRDRRALRAGAVRRDCEVAAGHRPGRADRRQLLGRDRQRIGVPRDSITRCCSSGCRRPGSRRSS